MFKRKIYNELLKWKKVNNGSVALLIEGARRIGKTTVAEEFGKNEYRKYVTIDFSKVSENFKKHFDNLMNVDSFFSSLFLDLGLPLPPKGSLIIFDEIQFCPKARQAIKTLVKDGRYHYIETGSLVSIKENVEDILIPSEEIGIEMYPMDYEEFLWALGLEYEAVCLRDSFKQRKPLSQNLHQTFMKHFRTYLAVGGMPNAVDAYIRTNDFYAVDDAKKRILRLYEEDLNKIDNKYGTICSLVWKQMPSMLSKHSSRFMVSSVDERPDSVLFKSTLNKLIESKIVIPVFKCNDPSGGFNLTKEESMFKLYFCDVGLFTSLIYPNNVADSRDVYQRLVLDKLSLNFGMLFENATAQILVADGFYPYYYFWSEKNGGRDMKYELDFLIYAHGATMPFEVKSKRISSIESLKQFKKKYGKNVGENYIVKSKPLSYGDNLTNLPFYMLFCLGE